MKILYECESAAVLQEGEMFVIHVLDNYRLVKEMVVNRKDLFSTLKEVFTKGKKKEELRLFKKNNRVYQDSEYEYIKKALLLAWRDESLEKY